MTSESPALSPKALGMLEHDLIAWIVTVDESGAPHAVPVWFFWHDARLVVFSEPDTQKVRHIRAGSRVLVHLQAGGEFGDDVLILHGDARIADAPASEVLSSFRDAYAEKYATAIADYGMGLEDIEQKFSTAIEFTPRRVQSW